MHKMRLCDRMTANSSQLEFGVEYMLIKIGDFEFTEVWDGVLYKKLSNYPRLIFVSGISLGILDILRGSVMQFLDLWGCKHLAFPTIPLVAHSGSCCFLSTLHPV